MTSPDMEALAREILEGMRGMSMEPWAVDYDEVGNGPDVRLIAFLREGESLGGVIDEECNGTEPPSPILEHTARCSPATIRPLIEWALQMKRERDEAYERAAKVADEAKREWQAVHDRFDGANAVFEGHIAAAETLAHLIRNLKGESR